MPAWHSIVSAKRFYLADLLGQGMIDNFSGLWRGHFAFSMAILRGTRRRREEGGHNNAFISQCLFEFVFVHSSRNVFDRV